MKNNFAFGLSQFGLLLVAALTLSLSCHARSRRSDAPSSDGTTGSSFGSTVSGSQSSDPRQNPSAVNNQKKNQKDYSNPGIDGMRDETVTGTVDPNSKPANPDSTAAGTGGGAVTTDGTYGSEKDSKTGTGH